MLNVECVRRYWHKRCLHFSDRPSSCRDSDGFLRKWMLWCCFLPIFVSSCLLVFSFFFFSILFLSLLVQGFKWRSPHVCVVIMCALSSCVRCHHVCVVILPLPIGVIGAGIGVGRVWPGIACGMPLLANVVLLRFLPPAIPLCAGTTRYVTIVFFGVHKRVCVCLLLKR